MNRGLHVFRCHATAFPLWVLYGALGLCPHAFAGNGMFVPVRATLDTPTRKPVLTLLPDRRVMTISATSTVAVYNPGTDILTAVATLTTVRPEASGLLLPNGKVLVLGGALPNLTTEVFDPANSTVAAGPAVLAPRSFATYTRLADGRIFVAGGCVDNGCSARVATTEIFDPATGQFTAGPNMAHSRSLHTATLLTDGRVLLVAGVGFSTTCPNVPSCFLNDAELYSPTTNSFTAKPILMTTSDAGDERELHATALAGNGTAITCGGYFQYYGSSYRVLGVCSIFHPATNTFTDGPTISPRQVHAATTLADGSVLMAGGSGIYTTGIDTADLYDPATGLGLPVLVNGSRDVMTTLRTAASAVRLLDGSVLFVGGGLDLAFNPLASMERYVPDRVFVSTFE